MNSPHEPSAAHREPLGPSASPRSVQHRIHGLGDEDTVVWFPVSNDLPSAYFFP
jgi:hypothetical protein